MLPKPDTDRGALAMCAADTSRTSLEATRSSTKPRVLNPTLLRRKTCRVAASWISKVLSFVLNF